jgi:putative transposase
MTYLLTFINIQEPIFLTLLTLLIGKSMFDKPTEQPVNKPYRKLQVDDLSIIKVPEKLDYQILITEYIKEERETTYTCSKT